MLLTCYTYHVLVALVEQDLLTLQEHMSPPHSFLVEFVLLNLVFCVMFFRSLFTLCFPFLLTICWLSFLDLRLFITPSVSSHFLGIFTFSWYIHIRFIWFHMTSIFVKVFDFYWWTWGILIGQSTIVIFFLYMYICLWLNIYFLCFRLMHGLFPFIHLQFYFRMVSMRLWSNILVMVAVLLS